MKIFILGSTGMIGHKIYYHFSKNSEFEIFNISKSELNKDTIIEDLNDIEAVNRLIKKYKPQIIINAAGLLIDDCEKDHLSAIKLNAYLPCFLNNISKENKFKLIQLSTDCVFSGKNGPYHDYDTRDATSIYGKTKSLGEVEENLTLRTSVIGPDLHRNGTELFNWFMKQKNSLDGYTKSLWSGITTLELAKCLEKLIYSEETGIKNISSNLSISKYDLLVLINKLSRKNLHINPVDGPNHNKCLIRSENFIHNRNLSYKRLITEMLNDIETCGLYKHY